MTAAAQKPETATISPLRPFQPDLYQRAWCSVPHPTLPLLATTHAKSTTIFSLATFTKHSALTGGHARSVRAAAWQPASGRNANRLRLATGSFDATAGMWSYGDEQREGDEGGRGEGGVLEREITMGRRGSGGGDGGDGDSDGDAGEEKEWEFNLVLEGHENEVKGLAFSPGGQFLATCSRDKSVWIWEDVSNDDDEDEWETVAVLSEHEGDVKAIAWCPDVPGAKAKRHHFSNYVLASASYDDTVRIWREDADGEWVCVAVLEGHGGTVWGLQWEGRERKGGGFPRLLTFSADGEIRIWTLKEEPEEEEGEGKEDETNPFRSGFSGIPNTMRRSLREEWDCTAVLPKVHTRDVYSASWSTQTGLVASTGSDGVIAVYAENDAIPGDDVVMSQAANGASEASGNWRVLGTVTNAHGPYEVNHITWCKRFDRGTDRKGEEEMLVTTGDDGVVRPWQVKIS
ncbi:Cytosolic iron-sulfur protein assembly protein [Madurella fahalii]|uniref:Probable cytosolic iron-sulfur protein assembly protein 1 n=1 Tax=Madurella fahalii TaxID=1157608 RepID=A0ABQ0G5N1_9PEZI